MGESLIDGVKTNPEDLKLINYDSFNQFNHTFIEEEMNKSGYLNKNPNFTHWEYKLETKKNCFRQLYCEREIGLFLEKNDFDMALVCGADYFLSNKLNLNDLNNSHEMTESVYTSIMNDARGYTNGFYFGRKEPIVKILKRLDYMNEFFPCFDYEEFLKKSFTKNKIERKTTDIVFFKIRANRSVFWSFVSKMLGVNCASTEEERAKVIEDVNRLRALQKMTEEEASSHLVNGLLVL